MENKKKDKGELLLLGFFALFIIVYLINIRTMPMDGKLLSYVLAPFILLTIIICFISAIAQGKKKKDASGDVQSEADLTGNEQKNKIIAARKRLYKTAAMGFFLFFSIFLLGFYIGSGVMLLVWFIIFKKINLTTLSITVLTPLLLYLPFEKLLDMGLPAGELFKWLGF